MTKCRGEGVFLLLKDGLLWKYPIEMKKSKKVKVWKQRRTLKSAHTRGLVPATSRGDKSHRVNQPFFLPQNIVAETKIWSL